MLPPGFDLVIWGHEHDCFTSLIPICDSDTRIYQPGSSVATSFTDGEALPKHIGLLEILPDASYRMEYIPLRSVREMVVREMEYVYFKEEDNRESPKTDKEIANSIIEFVYMLIAEANSSKHEFIRKAQRKVASS